MTPVAALAVLAGLVALAALLGVGYRLWNGRMQRQGGAARVRPAELLGAPVLGERVTLLQFSTELCAQCPQTRRLLGSLAAETPGVAHVEVDVTDDLETARRFSILRTPTVLVLDGEGAVRGRIGGAPRPAELRSLLHELLGTAVEEDRYARA